MFKRHANILIDRNLNLNSDIRAIEKQVKNYKGKIRDKSFKVGNEVYNRDNNKLNEKR